MKRLPILILITCLFFQPVHAQKRKGQRPAVSVDIPTGLLTGESTMQVSTTTAQIKIGLAETGVCLIEFPATDRLYLVHPGVSVGMVGGGEAQVSPQDVLVVDSSRRGPHDPLVLRPGPAFSVKGPSKCRAILTVQMVSGLIVTIQVFPVADVARNANRVVVSYDTNQIIQARAKAGLATVLTDQKEPFPVDSNPPTVAKNNPVVPSSTSPIPDEGKSGAKSPVGTSDTTTLPGPVLPPSSKVPTATPRPAIFKVPEQSSIPDSDPKPSTGVTFPVLGDFLEADNYDQFVMVDDPETPGLVDSVLDQMLQLVSTNHTAPVKFSRPVQGIALSGRETVFITPKLTFKKRAIQCVLVAVRNSGKTPIQLIPTHPVIKLETGPAGKPLNLETVEILKLKTVGEAVLKPGDRRWFAVAFTTQSLGLSQRVVLTIAHTAAADQPARLVIFGSEKE